MSEWRPIETAPPDTLVIMGRWEIYTTYGPEAGQRESWREDAGIAIESVRTWWGARRLKRTYGGERNAYWRPYPPPPQEDAG